jgi:hypothetical protein
MTLACRRLAFADAFRGSCNSFFSPWGLRVTRRSIWVVLGIILAALFLSGCDQGPSFRYRITVEVDTPQGLQSGSAVHEIEAHRNTWFVNSAVRGRSLRGEAVAVDLPGGRTLFALLTPSQEPFVPEELMDIVLRALDPTYGGFNTDYVETVRSIEAGGGLRERVVIAPTRLNPLATRGSADQRLRISNYPLLVTFTNSRDVASVVRVEPSNMTMQFGERVRLRRITVQVTDDRLSTTIAERLRLLGLQPGMGLDPTRGVSTNPTLAQRIGYDEFIRGIER